MDPSGEADSQHSQQRPFQLRQFLGAEGREGAIAQAGVIEGSRLVRHRKGVAEKAVAAADWDPQRPSARAVLGGQGHHDHRGQAGMCDRIGLNDHHWTQLAHFRALIGIQTRHPDLTPMYQRHHCWGIGCAGWSWEAATCANARASLSAGRKSAARSRLSARAEASLASDISDIETAATALASRVTAAESDINTLESDLSAEITTRSNAVSSEASTRASADTSLGNRLTALETEIDGGTY